VAASSPLSLCKAWPATAPAPASPAGISQTPTLILSGADDLRTPYEQALTIAATYANVKLLRIPDAGHSTVTADQTGCTKRAMIEFLTSGQAPASCRASREPQALPLPPPALGQVPPAASRSALAGRVAAAAAITLEDLFGQTSGSGGGLRGGHWEMELHGYALHGMLDVPGVALSGAVRMPPHTLNPLAVTAHLTVRGRLPGRLTLHGLTLNGHIGGTPVQARLAAL
jgi:hypothetical protein